MGHGRVSARRPVNSAGPASNRPGHWQSAAWTVKVTRTTPWPGGPGPLSHRPPQYQVQVASATVTSRYESSDVQRTGIRVVQPDSDVRRLVTSNRRSRPESRASDSENLNGPTVTSRSESSDVPRTGIVHRLVIIRVGAPCPPRTGPGSGGWDDTCEITRALMYQYVF